MKRGKALGVDCICVDLMKDAGGNAVEKLSNLFTECREKGKIPKAWKM